MSTSASTLSPSSTTASPSGIRFVISWEVPTDLDNHILIFDAYDNLLCHLYYSNRDCFGSYSDVDSIESLRVLNSTKSYYVLFFRVLDQKQ